jgi:phospholipase/carboxylesterase
MSKLDTVLVPAADKTSRRLMVMLHGLGDSIEGYRWWPEAMGLSDMNHLLVNAPDEYYGGYSWFDYPAEIGPGILRSRKMLFELFDSLRAQGFPTEQTTLGGFSQGCLMTVDVGLRYPHRFAGLVGISGWVFELDQLVKAPVTGAQQQRLLLTHGTGDPVIPIERTRPQAAALKAAGYDVTWREFPKVHTFHGETEMTVIREFVRAGYPVVGK